MGDKLIHSGDRFGNWVVLYATSYGRRKYWLCQCDCGNKAEVVSSKLRGGYSKRCNECRIKELRSNPTRQTHGFSNADGLKGETYYIWRSMKARIKNPNHHKYPSHGGSGLTLDPRWEKFEQFLEDIGEKPYQGASIERVDNEFGYWPSNCVWANRFEQGNNRHDNRIITANGKTQCSAWWARETGLKRKTIEQRLDDGWSQEDSVNIPLNATRRPYRYITPAGVFTSVAEAAKGNGVSRGTVHNRLISSASTDWRKE